ncbi:MAG: DMT family transporter [Labrys sp. (in: a-proteobacteria)]
MMPVIALGALALVAGFCLSAQTAVNSNLTRGLGSPITAAVISFMVGTTALWIAAFTARVPVPTMDAVKAVPAWAYVAGGLLGAFYMLTNTFLAPRLGVAITMSLIIAGQLAAAVVLDHFGLLGVVVREATPGRIAGVFVMFAGVLMIRFL